MSDFATIFETERAHLWGLLYRLTGSGADADDLLMDTFERALAKPPSDTSRSWRPWLTTVATNLARDALRRRRRRKYVGPWLPSLEDTSELPPPATPEARYSARESASYAFLKVLEVLTPNQRAVLVLRDVFDYTTSETAEMLNLTEANVKMTLHRARRAMTSYDAIELSLQTDAVQAAIAQLMQALIAGDARMTAQLLADDVVLTSDGAGEFTAALRPVVGAERTVRFLLGLQKTAVPSDIQLLTLNGLPVVAAAIESSVRNTAPYAILRIDLNTEGQITAIDLVMTPKKMPRDSSRPWSAAVSES